MRTRLRSKITLLFMTLGLLLAIPAIALADQIVGDADVIDANIQGSENLGTVAPGATVSPNPQVGFWLDCNGTNHLNPGQTVNITFGSASWSRVGGGAFTGHNATATGTSLTAPSAWPSDGTTCSAAGNPADFEGSGESTATITAPTTPGTYNVTLSYNKSIGSPDITGTTSVVFTLTVPSNTAPTVPGAPTTSTNPNQGEFTLNWTASTDAQSNPITYELQHRDANDPGFTTVTGAGSLNTNSFAFTNASPEAEGTWTYQVRASDGSLSSAFSAASSAIKVDKSAPNAPTASADRAPDYDGAGSNDWYKDTVTVSFSANGDPNLADGSAGSGVNLSTLTAPITKNTSGSHTVSGTVKDNVGLESAAGSLTVQVDATDPSVQITGCPTDVVGFNSTHNITVTANDAHSGLVSDPSGSVPLDTSVRGPQTKTITVQDNVGRSAQETCEYTVNRLPSDPGAPVLASGSSSPNQGEFSLNWTASTDDDGNLDHYVLQHKDADDAGFSDVDTNVSTNSYTFPAGSKEAEGTWTYRVKAVDSFGDESGYATSVADLVKVDKSAPNAPTASADRAPDYDGAGSNDWYKDTVTVSFSANGDPNLADGSAGSGVNLSTLTAPITKNTSGSHTVSGTVKDNVGLESAAGSLTVQVDTNAPTLGTCPSGGPFTLNSGSHSVGPISASDSGESGVDSANSTLSGSVNTSTVGEKTVTFTAKDNVGHSDTKQCTYSVIYNWDGFRQPVDNLPTLNTVKAGQSIPMKFSLSGNQGLNILQPATTTAPNPKVTAISCPGGSTPMDAIEQTTTANNGLTYDATADQYNYVWKTQSTYAGKCYRFDMMLIDGTTHSALFKFSK